MKKCITEFLDICKNNRGRMFAWQQYLSERKPEISMSYESLKTAVMKMERDDDDDDAQCLLDLLRDERKNGSVEFLHTELDEQAGILTFVIWAFKDASEIVSRCGDIVFWYSTHNATNYPYNLATFTVVDSEGNHELCYFR